MKHEFENDQWYTNEREKRVLNNNDCWRHNHTFGFWTFTVLIWSREWGSGGGRSGEEEMDGKPLGCLEDEKREGFSYLQQIEVTLFKSERVKGDKLILAVADWNGMRNGKDLVKVLTEGGEGDDRSLSMCGFYLKNRERTEQNRTYNRFFT